MLACRLSWHFSEKRPLSFSFPATFNILCPIISTISSLHMSKPSCLCFSNFVSKTCAVPLMYSFLNLSMLSQIPPETPPSPPLCTVFFTSHVHIWTHQLLLALLLAPRCYTCLTLSFTHVLSRCCRRSFLSLPTAKSVTQIWNGDQCKRWSHNFYSEGRCSVFMVHIALQLGEWIGRVCRHSCKLRGTAAIS